MTAGILYIVSTPIGNLGDLSPRAVQVLQAADFILAEDTRVTRKLCSRFDIETPLERFDEAVSRRRSGSVVERVLAGETLALVSDAGTPLLSDPGQELVAAAQDAGVPIEVVPGPSAITAALVSSGLPVERFYFGGFLPRKAGEQRKALESLAALDATLVFFESPHRTARTLQLIAQEMPDRTGAVARELTKLHEEVVRAPLAELAAEFAQREVVKGEVVLLIGPPAPTATNQAHVDSAAIAAALSSCMDDGMSPSRASREVAAELGVPKSAVYDIALSLKGGASS